MSIISATSRSVECLKSAQQAAKLILREHIVDVFEVYNIVD
jgi:hypothetical protein